MKPIHPLKELANRTEKRKYIQEVKKIASKIDEIQVQFELAVFDAPKSLTYQEIYDYFLNEWMSLVNKIIRVYKLRYCFIDLHFFERMYKPLER